MSYRARSLAPPSSTLLAKRAQNEKNQKILKTLAKQPSNKTCADCKVSTNPRWASWNIGVFICINCSGIHRSMGTHISKVKSIDLDSWTDEQTESMVNWGNEKANAYWEHNLPQNQIPDASKIQNFIRTKYELKKWVATKYLPDPKTIKPSASSATVSNILEAPKKESEPQKKDVLDLFSSPAPTTSSAAATPTPPKPPAKPSQSQGLLDLNLGAAPAPAPAPARLSASRPDLKQSILALYSNPSAYKKPNSVYQNSVQTQSTGALNAGNNVNGLGASLAGLNLGSQSSVSSLSDMGSNVWNSSPNLATKKNTGLEDDLFKNVWS